MGAPAVGPFAPAGPAVPEAPTDPAGPAAPAAGSGAGPRRYGINPARPRRARARIRSTALARLTPITEDYSRLWRVASWHTRFGAVKKKGAGYDEAPANRCADVHKLAR